MLTENKIETIDKVLTVTLTQGKGEVKGEYVHQWPLAFNKTKKLLFSSASDLGVTALQIYENGLPQVIKVCTEDAAGQLLNSVDFKFSHIEFVGSEEDKEVGAYWYKGADGWQLELFND